MIQTLDDALADLAPGEPSEVISSWLSSRSKQCGDATALMADLGNGNREEISFTELDSATRNLATNFIAMGLQKGDAIAIWLPNRPMWMIVHLAAVRAGLTTVPLNTWYRESELLHFLELTSARAIVVDSAFRGIDFASILQSTLSQIPGRRELQWLIDVSGDPGITCEGVRSIGLADFHQEETSQAALPLGENLAAITFATSGTTALPKLATHREGALVSHADAIVGRAEITREDKILCVLPPCGAYGHTLIMVALSAGAQAIQVPAHDLDSLVNTIRDHEITVMALTEPLIRSILDHPEASPSSLSSLRLVFSAGGTLEDVVARAEREFGFRITNVYGSSEILALASFWRPGTDVSRRALAGGELVSPGMRVRAVGQDSDVMVHGQAGELQFHGPTVTRGYFADENATRSAMTADGWLRSNDLGVVDDAETGVFRYIARMGDALRVKGFLVNPGEIEGKLLSHPAVAGAQVVGISDGRGEDLAVAFVELSPKAEATPSSLREFCGHGMASYKVPAIIEILEAFPTTRSANGDKVIKGKLRDLAKELVQHGE